jgi:hypothetical protein
MCLFDRLKDLIIKWEPHRKYLCEAIEYTNGTHTEDDVLTMIASGQLTLWAGEKSALVTEFSQFPRMKCLNVFIGGGDLEELRELETKVVPYAKQHNCTRITGAGRLGWTKTLPGYQTGGHFMFKDI